MTGCGLGYTIKTRRTSSAVHPHSVPILVMGQSLGRSLGQSLNLHQFFESSNFECDGLPLISESESVTKCIETEWDVCHSVSVSRTMQVVTWSHEKHLPVVQLVQLQHCRRANQRENLFHFTSLANAVQR